MRFTKSTASTIVVLGIILATVIVAYSFELFKAF
jgi:hypothetical protein